MYRQGDVLLLPVPTLPAGAVPEASDGDLILARGEATGHAHRIPARTAQLFSLNDKRYLAIASPTTLTHEEHATIDLPPGRYEVRIQREYNPLGVHQVLD